MDTEYYEQIQRNTLNHAIDTLNHAIDPERLLIQ